MKREKARPSVDELRAEYRFDYSKAKQNRFAARMRPNSVAVLLEPDVAAVFADSESVNTALRALVKAMPPKRVRQTSKVSGARR